MKLFFSRCILLSLAAVCACGSPDDPGHDDDLSLLEVDVDDAVGSTSWTWCASEGGYCSFSGTRVVRYGAGSSFATQMHTDGVTCANTVFGDPLYGTHKECWTASYVPAKPAAAPIGNLTNIYPLEQPVLHVKQGQNVTVALRFYGRPLPDDSKPFLNLLTEDGIYVGDLENHAWRLATKTWSGYLSFPSYVANASLRPGTYLISAGLYQGQDPWVNYYALVQGNGIDHPDARKQAPNVPKHDEGWVIGKLVIDPADGPPDLSVIPYDTLTPVPWN